MGSGRLRASTSKRSLLEGAHMWEHFKIFVISNHKIVLGS